MTLTAQQINDRARRQEIEYLRRQNMDENGKPLKRTGQDEPDDDGSDLNGSDDDEDAPDDSDGSDDDLDDVDTDEDPQEDDGDDDTDVEPDEDERRPKNTKTSVKDDTDWKAEYNRLKQENAALKGRVPLAQSQVASLQQRSTEYEAEIARLREENNQMRSQTTAADVAKSIRESLTEDEIANFGEEGLETMTKIIQTAIKAQVPAVDTRSEFEQLLRERDSQTLEQFKRGLIREDPRLSRVGGLVEDADFQDWLENNPEVESGLRDLTSQTDRTKIAKLAKRLSVRIADFFGETVDPEETGTKKKVDEKKTAKKPQVPNPSGSKAGLMRRRPEEPLSANDAEKLAIEAQRLARSRRPEDIKRYDEIMKKLNKLNTR